MKHTIRWKRIAALLLALTLLLAVPASAAAGFADVPEDSDAYESVQWALESGIAKGDGTGSFLPDEPCTAAAFVTFIWRLAGEPDMGEDAYWWSDAAAWAAEAGLLPEDADLTAAVAGSDLAVCLPMLGVPAPEGLAEAPELTRGEVVGVLYDALMAAAAAADGPHNDGTPWVDYSLKENVLLAEKPDSPKDDFNLYVNYDWLSETELRPGYVSESNFTEVGDEIMNLTKAALKDKTLASHDAVLAQHLFEAYLDWDARNALGVTPVRSTLDSIGAVTALDDLTALMSSMDPNLPGLVGVGVTTGLNDSTRYLLMVASPSLMLGDAAEYAQRTERGDRYYAAYAYGASAMLQRLGYAGDEAAEMFERAIAFESELAKGMMTTAETMQSDYLQRINNEMDRAGVEALCSVFPLTAVIDGLGYGAAERYLVTEPDYCKVLDQVYTAERLDDIKNYLTVRTALGALSTLDREADDLLEEMSAMVSGVTGSTPDEDAAYSVVSASLSTPLNRMFLEKYDSAEIRADITRICEECIAYYRTMLQGVDWLSDATKAKAIEKLDAITIHAVYPDKWEDYSGLSLDGLGFYDSVVAISRFAHDYNVSLLNTAVDPELWGMNILETNAYYNPQNNSINILRGILAGAFYREDMTPEELYAGIGMVIGHEISHAFDTQGSQFDASGNLVNWWTEEDLAAFTARAEKLSAYYSAMVAFDGYAVQGSNIDTEAIADMTGLKCMLGMLEQKGEVDYDAFFTGYAKLWRSIATREIELSLLMTDSHPLDYLRVNATLQQFQQFLDCYGIQEGDGMYLAPEDNVLVW